MEGTKEGLSNKEIDESPRSFAFVPIATPCIFDFLHATAQEMDSCIPWLEKGGWREEVEMQTGDNTREIKARRAR